MRALAFLLLLACDGESMPDGGVSDAGGDASTANDAGRDITTDTPADTYFALAIADDSHNHTGDRLLFLDFAEEGAFDTTERGNRVIQAPEVSVIALDGDLSDWDAPVTIVRGVPQNNYPLSEHYDAVPIPIEVRAAYDGANVYFAISWEDPGHAESIRRAEWTFGSTWAPAPVAPLVAGAPNENVVNAAHALRGVEDEDRLMMAFPIADPEGWFRDEGLGCAGMCHANLAQGNPMEPVGTLGVMNAGEMGASIDLWEWSAARSSVGGHADDWSYVAAAPTANGRVPDDGMPGWIENELAGEPELMHEAGFSISPVLLEVDAVPLMGTPSAGDTIPHQIITTSDGSRADVSSAAVYDATTFRWTIELRRLLDTGNDDDRAFMPGENAAPPIDVMREDPDRFAGGSVYTSVCSRCHGSMAQGVPRVDDWQFPRTQRASSSLILAALERVAMMRGLPVNENDVEDVAAFLQGLETE